ncbi:MAG: sugar transferase, partial [Sphingomonas hengshuiensis]
MIRLFKHYVPNAVLLLGLFDLILLAVAAEMGWVIRAGQIGMLVEPVYMRLPQIAVFVATLETAMIAVGVYSSGALQSLRFA